MTAKIRRGSSILCFTFTIMSSLAGAVIPPLILGLVGLILLPGNRKSTYNVRNKTVR